jgi:DNA topoisomerase-3
MTADLFNAPVRKVEADPQTNVCKHLQNQAKNADILILWLDCDREGENICFEVIENTKNWMKRNAEIYRARFSGNQSAINDRQQQSTKSRQSTC